jgi:hypothetical protein
MKTTIEISDRLLRDAKRLATRQGVTLRVLVERGLRHVVSEAGNARPFKLRDASFKGGRGLHPDARELGWDALRDSIYEGRGD